MKRNLKRMAAFGLAMTMAVGSTAVVSADSTQGGSTSSGGGNQTLLKDKFTVVMPYVAGLNFSVQAAALASSDITTAQGKLTWAGEEALPKNWGLPDGAEWDGSKWIDTGNSDATINDPTALEYVGPAVGTRLMFTNSDYSTQLEEEYQFKSDVSTLMTDVVNGEALAAPVVTGHKAANADGSYDSITVNSPASSNYSDWVWMQNRSNFDVYVEASARWISHPGVELVTTEAGLATAEAANPNKAYLFLQAQVKGLADTFDLTADSDRILTDDDSVTLSEIVVSGSPNTTTYDKNYTLSKDPLDNLIAVKDGKSYFILGALLPYVNQDVEAAWVPEGKNEYVSPKGDYGLWPTIGFRLYGEAAGTWTKDCGTTLEFVWRISTPQKSVSSNTTLNLNYTTLDKSFDLRDYTHPAEATKITGVEWNGYSMLEDIAGLGQMASVDDVNKMTLWLHSVALTNLFQENEMVNGNEIKVTVTFDKGDPVVYTVIWNKYGGSGGNQN